MNLTHAQPRSRAQSGNEVPIGGLRCDLRNRSMKSRAFQTFQSWQPISRMNRQGEITIREVSLFDMLEKSPSFSFIGTRGALAAYLIEKDAAHWNCVEYIILDHGTANRGDGDTRHWYVWRR